jgi:hypothetical protein
MRVEERCACGAQIVVVWRDGRRTAREREDTIAAVDSFRDMHKPCRDLQRRPQVAQGTPYGPFFQPTSVWPQAPPRPENTCGTPPSDFHASGAFRKQMGSQR